MVTVNRNYLKLPGSYLFSTIAGKVSAFQKENPEARILRLGIGDVTQPLAPAIIESLHRSVDEMAHQETFRGYAPDLGYEFLRDAIAKNDYKDRGCNISADEIFISDGAKSDSGNIQEIFGADNKVAVCDPVYPVYVDTNVMAGRTGAYNKEKENFDGVIYMPCLESNGFLPEIPEEVPDLIYLCFPNNPSGAAITREKLQEWVDYANRTGAVIIYDAAYEAYITETDIPHSIYECNGARTCAIELRSFSKNAGFTGVRLGFTVIPRELVRDGVSLHRLWARRHGTKFNGAPYIVQRAGEAVYSQEGKKTASGQVAYYMRKWPHYIYSELQKSRIFRLRRSECSLYLAENTGSDVLLGRFFDHLLRNAHVVGTPGSGFGAHGEGIFRLTAFGSYETTQEAIHRITQI